MRQHGGGPDKQVPLLNLMHTMRRLSLVIVLLLAGPFVATPDQAFATPIDATTTAHIKKTFVITLHQARDRQRAMAAHVARFDMPPMQFVWATNTTHVARYANNDWGIFHPTGGCSAGKPPLWSHEEAAAAAGEATVLAACRSELHPADGAQDAFHVLGSLGINRRALELGWHRSHPTVLAAFLGHMRIWESIASGSATDDDDDDDGDSNGEDDWYYVLEDDARVVNHQLGSSLRQIHDVPRDADVLLLGRHRPGDRPAMTCTARDLAANINSTTTRLSGATNERRHCHIAAPFTETCGGGLAHAYAISRRGAAKSLAAMRGNVADAIDVQWGQYFHGFSFSPHPRTGQVAECAVAWSNGDAGGSSDDGGPGASAAGPSAYYKRYRRLGLPVSALQRGDRVIHGYHPRQRSFGQVTQQSTSEAQGSGGDEVLLDPLPTASAGSVSYHGDTDSLLFQGEAALRAASSASSALEARSKLFVAAEAFRRALRNDDSNAVAHWDMGLLLMKGIAGSEAHGDCGFGNPETAFLDYQDGARLSFERAAQLAPNVDFIQYNLGIVAALAGRVTQSRRSLEAAMAVSGDRWPRLSKALAILESCEQATEIDFAECATMLADDTFQWALVDPWDGRVAAKRNGLIYGYNMAPKDMDVAHSHGSTEALKHTDPPVRNTLLDVLSAIDRPKSRLIKESSAMTSAVETSSPPWARPHPHLALILSSKTLFNAVDFVVAGGHKPFPWDRPVDDREQTAADGGIDLSQSVQGFGALSNGDDVVLRFDCLSADFGNSMPWPWEPLHEHVVHVAEHETACEDLPVVASDWPHALLALRGGCSFARKAHVASQAGYGLLLVGNYKAEVEKDSNLMPMTAGSEDSSMGIFIAMVSFEDAAVIIAQAAEVTTSTAVDPLTVSIARNASAEWKSAALKMTELIAVQEQQTLGTCGGDSGASTENGGECFVVGRQMQEQINRLSTAAYEPVYRLVAPYVEQLLRSFDGGNPVASQSFGTLTTTGNNQQVARNITGTAAEDAVRTLDTVRVVIVVFFGRRQTFEILHWYLDRNLRTSGGLVDEVILVPNTRDPEDVRYMRELLASYAWYRPSSCCAYGGWENSMKLYGRFYAEVLDPGTVYIKLDDDIVYIHEGAIESLVRAKLAFRAPSKSFVSANVVNHPRLSHLHQRSGLIRALRDDPWVAHDKAGGKSCDFTDDPWGRMEHGDWRCAAAIHESFLADLDAGNVHPWTQLGSPIDSNPEVLPLHGQDEFTRWSINAFALENRDLLEVNTSSLALRLLVDDEGFLSEHYPKDIVARGGSGIACVAAKAALMVHYSYSPQLRGWCEAGNDCSSNSSSTDWQGGLEKNVGDSLLSRYRAHAERGWLRWKEESKQSCET